MRIVADRAIPYIEHYFAGLGDLELLDGRAIDNAAVRDAEVLVVRTVTRVDANLLEGSRVGFVATATSGTNHVDTGWLAGNGIGFASAAGCNARAVAEYILSCLFVLADQDGRDLRSLRVGIVGCGNVGSTVRRFLDTCGIDSLVCDPPLAENGTAGGAEFMPLPAIRDADIITLHVPLETAGAWPTLDMIDGDFLAGVRDDAVIINTARGEVLDEEAVMRFLDARPAAAAVIDVWRNEPAINTDLLRRARLGTAHIAGYSHDARLLGTRMIHDRVCRFLRFEADQPREPLLPGNEFPGLVLRDQDDVLEAAALAVLSSYDVRSDSASLRAILELERDDRADYFDGLRNHYPLRREFPAMQVELQSCSRQVGEVLSALGFQVSEIEVGIHGG